jgi:hypothetical protein
VEGGSVDELLGVTVERPALDQLQIEVGRARVDRAVSGLTGDDREIVTCFGQSRGSASVVDTTNVGMLLIRSYLL